MAVRKQDDQHEHTFSSYVKIRDVVLKTCLGRWAIGRSGERGSEISVLPVRHDDDDQGIQKNQLISWTKMCSLIYDCPSWEINMTFVIFKLMVSPNVMHALEKRSTAAFVISNEMCIASIEQLQSEGPRKFWVEVYEIKDFTRESNVDAGDTFLKCVWELWS